MRLLTIRKIVISEEKTEIFLKVENRITGGNFCADKNICLVYPDGTRILLVSSNGIPVCPDTYKFRSPGEQLDFVLTFPPLLKRRQDLLILLKIVRRTVFHSTGLSLTTVLIRRSMMLLPLQRMNEPAKALVSFTKIAEENGRHESGSDRTSLYEYCKALKRDRQLC